jgi:GDPmannose 4,6-dehydratase
MWLMLQRSAPEDYVLATGVAISVREFVELVFAKLEINIVWHGNGISEEGRDQAGKVLIKIDQSYFRPTEVPFLLGDSTKARKELLWEPKYDLDALVSEMIDMESNAVSKSQP